MAKSGKIYMPFFQALLSLFTKALDCRSKLTVHLQLQNSDNPAFKAWFLFDRKDRWWRKDRTNLWPEMLSDPCIMWFPFIAAITHFSNVGSKIHFSQIAKKYLLNGMHQSLKFTPSWHLFDARSAAIAEIENVLPQKQGSLAAQQSLANWTRQFLFQRNDHWSQICVILASPTILAIKWKPGFTDHKTLLMLPVLYL